MFLVGIFAWCNSYKCNAKRKQCRWAGQIWNLRRFYAEARNKSREAHKNIKSKLLFKATILGVTPDRKPFYV